MDVARSQGYWLILGYKLNSISAGRLILQGLDSDKKFFQMSKNLKINFYRLGRGILFKFKFTIS